MRRSGFAKTIRTDPRRDGFPLRRAAPSPAGSAMKCTRHRCQLAAREHCPDRLPHPLVCVRDHQVLPAFQPTLDQAAQERCPERPILRTANIDAEHLSLALPRHPNRHHRRLAAPRGHPHAPCGTSRRSTRRGARRSSGGCGTPSTSVSSSPQIRETSDFDIPSTPKRLQQVIHLARRHAMHAIRLLHHRMQRALRSPPRLRATYGRPPPGPHLRNRQFDRPHPRVPRPRPAAIVVRPPARSLRSYRSAPINPATSLSISACDNTRIPSRSASPSCSSGNLPTNDEESIFALAIVRLPPCRPSLAEKELTERSAMAACLSSRPLKNSDEP